MHLRDDNLTESLKDWNKLVLYNPGNPLFIIQRAMLYLDLKDYDKAFLDLKNVISKRYDDENQFRGEQSILDKQLDLQFAVSYITRTIYGLSDDAMKSLKNGFCLMVMDKEQEAIKELRNSYNLQLSAVSLFLTALTFERSKEHDSAFVYYNKALALDRDIFDAHKKRAIYRSELKDWKGANEDFNEMIRLEPGLIVTYRLRALIRVQFKDFYGAIIDLTRYLKSDSTNDEIWMTRGYCNNAVKNYNGANYDYRKSLQLNKKDRSLYDLVVDSDLILRDTTHALETIKECEEQLGLRPDMFALRIRILISQNKIKEARESMEILTREKFYLDKLSDSQTSIVFFLEGWMDYVDKEFNKALKKLNKSVQMNQGNHEAIYLRSKIYLESGNKTAAIKDLHFLS